MAHPPGATISAVTTLQASTAPGGCKVSFRHSLSLWSCGPGRSLALGAMAVVFGRAVLSEEALGLI